MLDERPGVWWHEEALTVLLFSLDRYWVLPSWVDEETSGFGQGSGAILWGPWAGFLIVGSCLTVIAFEISCVLLLECQ